MKRFHIWSEYFLETGPIVFHSFCNATNVSVVSFQSVLSFRLSAFSHKTRLASKFLDMSSFTDLKNSAFCLKKLSHDSLKRSKSWLFTFLEANPNVFHSSCMAMISFVFSSHAANDFNEAVSIASIFSQRAILPSSFFFSFSFCDSKYCWCLLFITEDAFLKRFHNSSRNSLATGPTPRHSSCSCCNERNAEMMSSSEARASAASHKAVFWSKFFLKS